MLPRTEKVAQSYLEYGSTTTKPEVLCDAFITSVQGKAYLIELTRKYKKVIMQDGREGQLKGNNRKNLKYGCCGTSHFFPFIITL